MKSKLEQMAEEYLRAVNSVRGTFQWQKSHGGGPSSVILANAILAHFKRRPKRKPPKREKYPGWRVWKGTGCLGHMIWIYGPNGELPYFEDELFGGSHGTPNEKAQLAAPVSILLHGPERLKWIRRAMREMKRSGR